MAKLATKQSHAVAASLKDLAAKINAGHRAVHDGVRRTLTAAMGVGDLLLKAKEQVPPGEFIQWVDDHCEFKLRSAQTYMRIAANRKTIGKFKYLDEAIEALSTSRTVTGAYQGAPENTTNAIVSPGKSVATISPNTQAAARPTLVVDNSSAETPERIAKGYSATGSGHRVSPEYRKKTRAMARGEPTGDEPYEESFEHVVNALHQFVDHFAKYPGLSFDGVRRQLIAALKTMMETEA